MVDSAQMIEDLNNIVKEGWLEKESKFLKSWRRYNYFQNERKHFNNKHFILC